MPYVLTIDLRTGAIAARAPVMRAVAEQAAAGVAVLGVCNGFQILCEAGLLPGALTKNLSRRFQDEWVELEQKAAETAWSARGTKTTFRLPIAHSLGRFTAPPDVLKRLTDEDCIWLVYKSNPNGSLNDIAGVTNKKKNVAALMPHPERAMHDWMGSEDGKAILERVKSHA